MRVVSKSINEGYQILNAESLKEVTDAIGKIELVIRRGVTRQIREELLMKLRALGWSGSVRVSSKVGIRITSQRDKVGLCVQLGNVARLYADLLKLQTMYADGTISAGILILPSESASHTLGSNIANGSRLLREMPVFSKVITMPLMILEIE